MPSVVVIVENLRRFEKKPYFLHLLISEWQRSGWDVKICADLQRLPHADAAILHVDLTRLPGSYLALSGRYPVVMNMRAVDISKRRISQQLLKPEDDYRGPVIVKTDANAGGVGERAARYGMPILGRLRRILDRNRQWTRTGILNTEDYPVYPSIREVPPEVWKNPRLVVERFIAERHGDNYALRQWVFLGDRELSRISYGKNPVVKARNIIGSESLDSVPDSLRIQREELGFDYGKFDYVLHEGRAILLDANRTPTAQGRNLSEKGKAYASALADGIRTFIS